MTVELADMVETEYPVIVPVPHKAPPDNYDHDKYPFGPPVKGKYRPKNANAKYRLLVGQYVGEDGKQYIAGVPDKDIVPESTKHPEGLARWPEKFQRLVEDRFTQAVWTQEETIEQLEARLMALKAGLTDPSPPASQGTVLEPSPPVQKPAAPESTLDVMTLEELVAHATECEYNLGGARTRDQILKVIKKLEGLK
jgi:hypothetical protein